MAANHGPNMTLFNERSNAAMETATGPPAIAMLTQAGLLPAPPPNAVILDNACGAGGVGARFFERANIGEEGKFLCGDLQENMVKSTEERIAKYGWKAEARVLDAHDLPFSESEFTHTLMCFGPQLMKDPIQALREMKRVLRPHGTLGFTCWISAGWYPTMCTIVPDFAYPPPMAGNWTKSDYIQSALLDLGFEEVKLATLDFTAEEKDVEALIEIQHVLFAKVLTGKVGERHDAYLREEAAREGGIVWKWQALIVTAKKP